MGLSSAGRVGANVYEELIDDEFLGDRASLDVDRQPIRDEPEVAGANRDPVARGVPERGRRRDYGADRATLCHGMDVSVRELRNHTARVIAAVESGEPVVLTVHGRPVADIVPRQHRSERRPTEQLLADLTVVGELAAQLDVSSATEDFDVGLTTDDMLR